MNQVQEKIDIVAEVRCRCCLFCYAEVLQNHEIGWGLFWAPGQQCNTAWNDARTLNALPARKTSASLFWRTTLAPWFWFLFRWVILKQWPRLARTLVCHRWAGCGTTPRKGEARLWGVDPEPHEFVHRPVDTRIAGDCAAATFDTSSIGPSCKWIQRTWLRYC